MEASMSRVTSQRSAILAGAALALAAAAFAQEAPKPGPEHKKLEFYAGKWTSESEVKPNPFMPPGKYTATDKCDWFHGGFALMCHSEGGGPTGPMKAAYFLGYSAEDKVYTYYGVDSAGMVPTSVAKGTVQGDTWTYTDESKMGGKLVKSRYTIKQLSPKTYTFKWETEGEGGAWSTVMEGKSTREE
jgi:hypothetical protein